MPMHEQDISAGRYNSAPLWKVPVTFTTFIGREQDVAAICLMLLRPEMRLLTLLGTGGVGKTRVSLSVAHEMRSHFADGVCFVALAALAEAERVIATIAEALDIQEVAGQSVFEQVIYALQNKHLLLILDNFEQVIDASPRLEVLLSACPNLTLLVTSRVALHLQAEHEFPVQPLALPPLQQLPLLDLLPHYAAVALFVQRVQAVLPTFQLNHTNAEAIAEICVRLDGLPLALELAAARSKLLPPQALLSRLSEMFSLLSSEKRTVPARHQTLRNAIQWSYDLLDEEEQWLFRQLSIFVGGWTLPATEALCAGRENISVLDSVSALLDKSLLYRLNQDGQEARLHMLLTVREYGLACLRENGEIAATQEAHAIYYLTLAEEAEPHIKGRKQLAWLTALEQEQENFRVALQWFIEQRQTESALRLCAALARFWLIRGYLSEGRYWMKIALELPRTAAEASAFAHAQVLLCAGENALMLGEVSNARSLMEESLVCHRVLQNKRGITQAAGQLGRLLYDQSDFVQGKLLLEESVALSHAMEEQWTLAFALHNLGRLLWQQNDLAGASTLIAESLTLYRQIGDRRGLAIALGTMARFSIAAGDATKAFALWNEELALLRVLHDRINIVNVLNHSGYLLGAHGDSIQAEARLHESQAMAQEIGYKNGLTQAKSYLSQLERSRGNIAQAAHFAKECLALFREMGEPLTITYQLNVLGEIQRDMGELARAKDSFMEGFLIAQRVGYQPYLGWHLYGMATIAIVEQQSLRAARLFGAAENLLDAELQADPLEREQYEQHIARLRLQLSAEAFRAAWAEGQAMTPGEAIGLSAHTFDTTQLAPRSQFSAPGQSLVKSPFPDALTPREVEVLQLLARGWTDAQIAEHLIISPRTVNRHTTAIYSKIRVVTRSAATRYAVEKSIV